MSIRAVGLRRYLPVENEESLVDVRIDEPVPGEWDLAVRVATVSVNPVDVKVRSPKDRVEEVPRILGWDAAGVVSGLGKGPPQNKRFTLLSQRIIQMA